MTIYQGQQKMHENIQQREMAASTWISRKRHGKCQDKEGQEEREKSK